MVAIGAAPARNGTARLKTAAVPSFVGSRIAAERPRILIADDNADLRDYLANLLTPRYEAHAVEDGEAAVRAARHCKPDLVLTDVMMPKLDGFGLLRQLRSEPPMQTTPVIMLSARAGEEARVEGLEAGADDYLIKPFSVRELLARVASQLELARVRREAATAIRASKDRFDALVAASSDVVYRMSPDWTEMRQLVGREFIADTLEPSHTWPEEYIHRDDRPHVMEVIDQAPEPHGSAFSSSMTTRIRPKRSPVAEAILCLIAKAEEARPRRTSVIPP